MIALLAGTLQVKNPTRVVIQAGGIGFELTVPLSTAKALAETGKPVALFVQSVFSPRTGMTLFGFATAEERNVFNRLTAVRGIGPKAALNMLSRFSPAEVQAIITEGRVETLKTVPGIGPRRAELILGRAREAEPVLAPDPQLESAISALTALGLTRAEATKRLEQIPDRASLPLNEILTRALRCES